MAACVHWRPPRRGVVGLPRKRFTGDARADPRATSPSRWAAPGGQDLRGSSPALLSYGGFAAERHGAKMRLDAHYPKMRLDAHYRLLTLCPAAY